ncbi:MAG: secretin N-terminal domain-containing protein, partial [Sedimentisphaerales bacterium]
MKEKNRFPGGGHIGILALVVALLFSSNYVVAGQQTAPPKEANFKIFSLKHISVEQGEDYLAKFVTGTITHFPGSSTLLVTAQPGELAKAQILLNLLDEPGQFVTKTLLPVSAARSIPSNEQIAARLSPSLTRGVSIGSFSHPPSPDAKIKAIIDIHNDAVVAIAPPSLMDQIVSVLGRQFQDSRPSVRRITQTLPPIPPARKGPGIIEPDDTRLFLSADSSVETDPNAIAQAVEDESAEGSPANRSYQLPPLVNGEQIVDLALGERQKLTIAELLGLVGPYLQLDFLYTEEEVDQKITISPNGKWAGPVKIKDLYPMLETVLKYKNLVMTRSGSNLVTIAPKANALDIDPTLVEDGTRQIKRGDGILQRIFKLNHIETSVAKKLLEEMKLYTSITEVPETKTLIVTAYAYRMPRIQALLDIVDRPGKPRRFRFRPLQYTMAEALAPKLQTLAEQLGTISITIAADESTPKATPRPVKRPTESTTAYNARLRQWSAAQAQRARSAAAARRSTSSTQQTEPSEPSVYVEADERTNRILMVGFDEQLDDVEKLIETLDVAQQDLRSLESYNIEHVDAEEVKAKLEELGIISPSLTSPYYNSRLTGDSKSPTASSPTAARTRSPAAIAKMQQSETAQTPLDEPQVVVIEQTNSLLVNATAEQHAKIHKIVEYVDSEPKEGDIPVKIYPLENQSPDHLAEVIKPLIEETIMDKEGKAVQEVKKKQPEDQIEIVPDPNTFSLVVYASKKNQIWIGDLIEKLDQRRPQVLIDVTLVQISKEDKFDYDLNIISSVPDLTQTSGLTSAIMAGVEGAANNNLVSNLTNSSRDRFIDLQSNGGYGTGFYGDKHINLLLTAMQEKNYGR